MGIVEDFAQGMLREYRTFAGQCVALVAVPGDETAAELFAMEDLPLVAERLSAFRARAEAAEQRAEAAEAEVARLRAELAQARADRALLAGLWLVTVPPDLLLALLPTDQGDRDRLAAALDAVDLQASAESHTAAGRAVIARPAAETAGGAR